MSGDTVRDISSVLEELPVHRYPYPPGDQLIAHLSRLRPIIESLAATAREFALSEVELLCPVANPSKIIAAPINYQSHIDLDLVDSDIAHKHTISHISHAGLFLKATSSLVGAGQGTRLKYPERRTDHEIELVVIIGRECRDVPLRHALNYVAGYTVGLDMTLRGQEDRSFRKSFDSYSVVGPWLTTADEVEDPGALELELRNNSELKQKANTRDLIYSVPRLIEYASNTYTLYPGDILFTGTPHGVAPVIAGDQLACTISQLGTMHVSIQAPD